MPVLRRADRRRRMLNDDGAASERARECGWQSARRVTTTIPRQLLHPGPRHQAFAQRAQAAQARDHSVELALDDGLHLSRQRELERVAIRDERGVLDVLALHDDRRIVARRSVAWYPSRSIGRALGAKSDPL